MMASSVPELLQSVAVLVMSVTGGLFLIVMLWKGRSIHGQWKDLKIVLNPQAMQDVQNKLDEVVRSVNNKSPADLTLFQRSKVMEQDIKSLNRKFDLLLYELRNQVGLRIEVAAPDRSEGKY